MNRILKKTFLNDHFILAVILINSVAIYLQESGLWHPVLIVTDILCTLFFLTEMTLKHLHFGWRGYWSDGWNRMDGILVVCSLPSFITPFVDVTTFNFSILIMLRLLRVLRLLRILHFFPNITRTFAGLKRAMRDSGIVLVGFLIILLMFGMVNCSLYREVAPEYFGTPADAVYTVFRIFTVEGWYEIPDAISAATSPLIGRLSRLYFCLILGMLGMLGMSFINSVFVDAMVEDNNDDVKKQLRRLEKKIDTILRKNDDNPCNEAK